MVESESVYGLLKRQPFVPEKIKVLIYVNTQYDSVRMLPDASLRKSLELRMDAIENDKSLSKAARLARRNDYYELLDAHKI